MAKHFFKVVMKLFKHKRRLIKFLIIIVVVLAVSLILDKLYHTFIASNKSSKPWKNIKNREKKTQQKHSEDISMHIKNIKIHKHGKRNIDNHGKKNISEPRNTVSRVLVVEDTKTEIPTAAQIAQILAVTTGVKREKQESLQPQEGLKRQLETSVTEHGNTLHEYLSCLKGLSQKNIRHLVELTFPEIEEQFRKACFIRLFGNENGNICRWPSNELVGPLLVDMNPINPKDLRKELGFVREGGWWTPTSCISRHKVAIIIPFRDRETHLTILLRQLHGIFRRQELTYRVFVIEQADEYPFNRGKLMNIGYAEALKWTSYSCFVFHDVDLIPENDLNDYGCPTSPRHLSCAIDKFDYTLPYPGIFGGVEMFVKQDFITVNGFPNSYWGWGAEDDNLYKRVSEHKLHLTRPSMQEGRYKMIKHEESQEKPPNRHDKLSNANEEFQTDGISSLQYKVLEKKEETLYTRIKVDLNMEGDVIY